ncbi:MAG: ABC transporter permease [Prevotella sp.]|nr:ABC transporter permease [Prevotella sp.]
MNIKSISLKSYLTFLSRNKAYTLINMLGFSLSLMFVIIITLYTEQEFGVDKSIDNADRIYSVCMGSGDSGGKTAEGTGWRIQQTLKNAFPDIEMTCAVTAGDTYMLDKQDNSVSTDILFADSTFFRMISIPLVTGDRQRVLDQQNSAVVSEEYARKMFGDADPIGQQLRFKDEGKSSVSLRVTGVFTSTDGTSFPHADVVIRFENVSVFTPSITAPEMNNAAGTTVLLLTREGSDIMSKERQMDKVLKDMGFWIYNMPGLDTHTKLLRLSDRYFSDVEAVSGIGDLMSRRGDFRLVTVLFAVALIILVFSITNYVNLTVAQSSYRAKEMATRRLLGSQRSDIMLRLIAECSLLCLACLAVGVALSAVALPYANHLLDTDMRFADLLTVGNIGAAVVFVLLVGLLSGLLPAIVISRAKPIDVVRGTFRLHTKMRFSRVFIVFQNIMTIFMIAASLTMVLQVRHLVGAPLGYDYKHLVVLPAGGDSIQTRTLLTELRKLPCVTGVTACQGYPFDGGNNNTTNIDNRTLSFQVLQGDADYMRTLGIKLLRDYHLDDPEAAYVNKQTLAELGLPMDARSFRVNNGVEHIRGVIDDIKIRTVTSDQHPLLIYISKEMKYPWNILVRVRGDESEAYERIKDVYRNVTDMDLTTIADTPYLDQLISQEYVQEKRISTIVTLFATIAIIISLLGLVAMSTYFIEQRRKEIAIRKVFGSTSRQIYVRLVRTFLSYVGVAFVIAVPLIYHFMTQWLSNYNYRIDLGLWIYAVAGATCLLVSFAAVMVQSHHAANTNPAESIKME